jgi:hypothetical protein
MHLIIYHEDDYWIVVNGRVVGYLNYGDESPDSDNLTAMINDAIASFGLPRISFVTEDWTERINEVVASEGCTEGAAVGILLGELLSASNT